MTNIEPEISNRTSDYLQNVLDGFMKSKHEYLKEKDDCARLREVNHRLEMELREAREVEKSHRYDKSTSREIICSLQESISSLVPLKRDIKKLTSELDAKVKIITSMEEEKERLQRAHKSELQALANTFERQMERITIDCDAKILAVEKERDTQAVLCTFQVAELDAKIANLETEHKEKMNMVVLEYEERLQREASQYTQLRDQHAGLIARTDASIELYRKKIQEQDEKLKQREFKQFLSSNPVTQNIYTAHDPTLSYHIDTDIVDLECDFQKPPTKPIMGIEKTSRGFNKLQVVQIPGNKTEKTFSIVKKRKLYTAKNF